MERAQAKRSWEEEEKLETKQLEEVEKKVRRKGYDTGDWERKGNHHRVENTRVEVSRRASHLGK